MKNQYGNFNGIDFTDKKVIKKLKWVGALLLLLVLFNIFIEYNRPKPIENIRPVHVKTECEIAKDMYDYCKSLKGDKFVNCLAAIHVPEGCK